MSLETSIIDLIEGRKKQPVALFFLTIISGLFSCIVSIRNFAYDKNLIKSYQSKIPVISVGNIVAGGTGKTPLVQKIAEELIKKNKKVAIISRGYRSLSEKAKTSSLLSFDENLLHTCKKFGDEPVLHAKNCEKALVIVGKDRRASLKIAEEKGADIAILDDGMQHRKVKRDCNIVVINAHDPLGKGKFLPRGYLRESPSSLKRADLIVVMSSSSSYQNLKFLADIKKITDSPIVIMKMGNEGGEIFNGKKIALFCAIGNPERAALSLKKCGADVVKTYFEKDHESFSQKKVESFCIEAKKEGAELLVTTEKDAIKTSFLKDLALPVHIAKLVLSIHQGADEWNQFIEKFAKTSSM